jgi:hypothetical protein
LEGKRQTREENQRKGNPAIIRHQKAPVRTRNPALHIMKDNFLSGKQSARRVFCSISPPHRQGKPPRSHSAGARNLAITCSAGTARRSPGSHLRQVPGAFTALQSLSS